jgi:hypothetical protein
MRSSSLLLLFLVGGCITPARPPVEQTPAPPLQTPPLFENAHPRAIANRALLSLLTRAAPRGQIALICDSTDAHTREVARQLELKLRQERNLIVVSDGQPDLILSVANAASELRCELRRRGVEKPHWIYRQALAE